MQEAYTPAVPWRHPARRGRAGRHGDLSTAPTALVFALPTLLDTPVGAPHEGVREMLAALSAAGYPLGVVGGAASDVESALAPTIFDVAVADSDEMQAIPERLGIPVAKVAFIGGSQSALSAARVAGMPVAAALWCGENLLDPAPEWRFERPADVTRAFARWC